mmetsp:Transcript_172778/g.553865  ORF Transcript_172778/g.553865 Transcript_172778/m.553865 type:complete len:83 (-) Transcript_172778:426-674(-)
MWRFCRWLAGTGGEHAQSVGICSASRKAIAIGCVADAPAVFASVAATSTLTMQSMQGTCMDTQDVRAPCSKILMEKMANQHL